ncbi:MAG: gfo/Idh/MocA family oxidoreductase [Paenibacillus sp.]|nr:gfo/Idh/MocA family oxidoreductase [Paenibacillus sp.]
MCNRSKEKMVLKAATYGVPDLKLYSSMDHLLADGDVDVIDIVTGPETHLDFVCKAAKAGKHIMCQKPFAATLEEAEAMVKAAREAGVRLMVTENWRWLTRFQTIKRVIEEGVLGNIQVARYIHSDYYTPRMAPGVILPQPYFREMPHLLFYEMGVHWFDTWRFLFGTPKRLYAETITASPHIKGEDSGIVVLGYKDFYGFLDMSWATRQKLDEPLGEQVGPVHLEQLVVDGDQGTLKMYTNGKISVVSKDGARETTVLEPGPLDHELSHVRLQSHFIDCLNDGSEFLTNGQDNLVTLAMVFGTYRSAMNHQPIFFQGGEALDDR